MTTHSRRLFRAGDVTDKQRSVNEIESCLIKVGTWMNENRLKMNAQKTELIFLGSRQQLKKCETSGIKVIDEKVERTKVTKYLGSWLDENLSFAKHATMKCKAAMWNIHRIRNIHSYLDKSTCESLVVSLVTPHLDYGNGLLIGATDTVIGKFQRIQNIAAKLILNRSARQKVQPKCNMSYIGYQLKQELNITYSCLFSSVYITWPQNIWKTF